MKILKRNGTYQNLSFDKILYRNKKLAFDKHLGNIVNIDIDIVSQKVIERLYDGISSSEIDEETARLAISMSIDNPQYGELASRVIISNMHKNTTECFSEAMEILYSNVDIQGNSNPLINDDVMKTIRQNKELINFSIDYYRDYLFDYFGYKTLERSYLLKTYDTKTKKLRIVERPQHMWMRVSLGIHRNDVNAAINTYNLMSKKYFTHASPTLYNSASLKEQNSSCFLFGTHDSLSGIFKTISDSSAISKYAGGIGIHISNIRANKSYIRGTNGYSDGIIPMLKVYNETSRYANQGGKRKGSIAIYLEPWHADVLEFLELRKNNGDENLRARDLFYALWVPDLFMKCVEQDLDWYLMCPDECPGLNNVYGDNFENLYQQYVNEGKFREKLNARKLWNRILVSQVETGMPYICYKDNANKKSNQMNIGTIKSSNLCVAPETMILTSEGYLPIYTLENKQVKVWNGKVFSKTKVIKTHDNQELIKISFSNGETLDCTLYHKFYIEKNNKEIIVEARNLKPGMKIINVDFPFTSSNMLLCDSYDYGVFCGIGKYVKSNGELFPFIYVDENKSNSKKILDNLTSVISKTKYKNINVCKLKIDNSKYLIPTNFSLHCKLKWLEGFLDVRGIKNKNYNSIKIKCHNQDFSRNLRYFFNTLGCNPVISYKKLYLNIKELIILKKLGLPIDEDLLISKGKEILTNNIYVSGVSFTGRYSPTYCFNELLLHRGIFNGIITGQCAEVFLYSDEKEYAVCNIATLGLSMFVKDNKFDYAKLREITHTITENLNNIIDVNYYPVKETEISNKKHRPIIIGVQGLYDTFMKMRIPFESNEAIEVNKKIFETIQYAALEKSNELAKIHGPYSTFEGSPASQGLFQHNLWGLSNQELSGMYDWDLLKENVIKYGLRNSLVTGLPPTASTSQILGNIESFEPITSNVIMRNTLSGTFPIVNKYLINDLIKLNLWNKTMKNTLLLNQGSIQNIPEIPDDIKKLYKTIWEIKQKTLIDLSADRGPFIDHSQSFNIFLAKPELNVLNTIHFYGWKKGLKTGCYYLRTRAASAPEQFTVSKESSNQVNDTSNITKSQEELVLACSLANPGNCDMCSG